MSISVVVIVVTRTVIQDGTIVTMVSMNTASQTICIQIQHQDQDQKLETNTPHKNPTTPMKTAIAAVKLGLTSRSSQR